MFIIGRAINGISINGKEYLLNKADNIHYFESIYEAVALLKSYGYTNEEIEECISIEEE
jgi:hypothetical protein